MVWITERGNKCACRLPARFHALFLYLHEEKHYGTLPLLAGGLAVPLLAGDLPSEAWEFRLCWSQLSGCRHHVNNANESEMLSFGRRAPAYLCYGHICAKQAERLPCPSAHAVMAFIGFIQRCRFQACGNRISGSQRKRNSRSTPVLILQYLHRREDAGMLTHKCVV